MNLPRSHSPTLRKFLFACLYFSEGAPIGFIWLALPTRLRIHGVPVEKITWLMAVVVLPWTFKFVFAPLVDIFRSRRWTLRHWVVSAQCMMGITLVPLLWLNPRQQFAILTGLLVTHAFAAATQDVAIDALCISLTTPGERGQYNGWMQTGMLLGRAAAGGGALVLASYVSDAAVVGTLIFLTTFSLLLLVVVPLPIQAPRVPLAGRWDHVKLVVGGVIRDRNTWQGLLFALLGGAGFKSLEVIYGPYLVDRGFSQQTIGWFSAGPMMGSMIAGSLLGGWLSDRNGSRLCATVALTLISFTVVALATVDAICRANGNVALLFVLAMVAVGIGGFTAASYALFMDVTRPAIAAAQFSAFMGATNGCESWSSYVSGRVISRHGYPASMLLMSLVSLLALPLVFTMRTDQATAESRPDQG